MKHWPLAATLAVVLAVLGACLVLALRRTDGHFAYVLDDPYIHMAVAKNLTEHGVFGVTRHGYTSSTSSMIWPILISVVYLVTGPQVLVPWLLSMLFSAAALWLAYVLLARHGMPPWLNFVSLLIIAFCAPLPAIVFTGLEHSLHVLLALAYVYVSATVLAEATDSPEARHGRWLWVLPPLLVMTRYEGAFMVAVVCLMFALCRRLRTAVAMSALGAAPVVLGGLVSMAHGWHFLPNPVLLKGRIATQTMLSQKTVALLQNPAAMLLAAVVVLALVAAYLHHRRLTGHGQPAPPTLPAVGLVVVVVGTAWMAFDVAESWQEVTRLWEDPHWDMRWAYVHEIYLVPAGLTAMAVLLAWSYHHGGRRLTANKAMLWVVLGTTLLHLTLAQRGWFWRYEAYLVATGLLVVLLAGYEELFKGIVPAVFRRRMAWCAAAGVLAVPFAVRGVRSVAEIPRAAMNIYEQQYQIASFLEEFYTGRSVAANDVGAINYYADVHCLDLWGLSNLQVADARLEGNVGPEQIHSLCQDNSVDVAVVFDKWCEDEFGGVPPQWEKLGEWEIADNLVCGWYVVSFYAVKASEARSLEENLAEFSPKLPKRVIQRGSYVQSTIAAANAP